MRKNIGFQNVNFVVALRLAQARAEANTSIKVRIKYYFPHFARTVLNFNVADATRVLHYMRRIVKMESIKLYRSAFRLRCMEWQA